MGIFILELFSIISFCDIFNSGLVTSTTEMKPSVSWFKNAESRLNHHLSGLFGVSSLAWTGHLVHVAIPASRENLFDGIIS
ncbi:hypothetical protein IC575_031028 [Cucumis melo]